MPDAVKNQAGNDARECMPERFDFERQARAREGQRDTGLIEKAVS